MKSFSQYVYKDLLRWDMIKNKSFFNVDRLPKIDKIIINIHESSLQNKKDKYILAFLLEILSGQRVSPLMLFRGTYKKTLVVKKAQPLSGRTQITLRGRNMYTFFDRWVYLSIPRAFQFSGIKNLTFDKSGGTTFYYDDVFSFLELDGLNSLIHKCNGLQIHIVFKNRPKIENILWRFHQNVSFDNIDANEKISEVCLWSPEFKSESTHLLSSFFIPTHSSSSI